MSNPLPDPVPVPSPIPGPYPPPPPIPVPRLIRNRRASSELRWRPVAMAGASSLELVIRSLLLLLLNAAPGHDPLS